MNLLNWFLGLGAYKDTLAVLGIVIAGGLGVLAVWRVSLGKATRELVAILKETVDALLGRVDQLEETVAANARHIEESKAREVALAMVACENALHCPMRVVLGGIPRTPEEVRRLRACMACPYSDAYPDCPANQPPRTTDIMPDEKKEN